MPISRSIRDIVRFRSCGSKTLFATMEEAEHARKSNEGHFRQAMKSYRCPFCKSFHLARKKEKK